MNESTRAMFYHHFAKDADLMIVINEKTPGAFTAKGRFRYYMEDTGDPFADQDKKMWFENGEPLSTLMEALERIKELSAKSIAISAVAGGPTKDQPHICIRGSDTMDEFFKKIRELPFVHAKEASAADLLEMGSEADGVTELK